MVESLLCVHEKQSGSILRPYRKTPQGIYIYVSIISIYIYIHMGISLLYVCFMYIYIYVAYIMCIIYTQYTHTGIIPLEGPGLAVSPTKTGWLFWGRWNHGCRPYVDIPRSPFKKPGWWCNNHLEKYEFVNGKDDIPYMKWKITNVWNHQPETCSPSYFFSQFAMEIHHQNALVIRNMVCWKIPHWWFSQL